MAQTPTLAGPVVVVYGIDNAAPRFTQSCKPPESLFTDSPNNLHKSFEDNNQLTAQTSLL